MGNSAPTTVTLFDIYNELRALNAAISGGGDITPVSSAEFEARMDELSNELAQKTEPNDLQKVDIVSSSVPLALEGNIAVGDSLTGAQGFLILGKDASNNAQTFSVDGSGNLNVALSGLAGLATQTTLAAIDTKLALTNGYVDGIEGLIGTTNSSLSTIAGYVDGIETLIGTSNSSLSTISSTLSTISGNVDGLEALVGTTNSTLSTISSTLSTISGNVDQIEGYVDGIEALIGTTNTNTSNTNTSVGTTNTSIGATNETVAGSDTATSGLNGLIKRVLQRLTALLAGGTGSITQVTATTSSGTLLAANTTRKSFLAKNKDTTNTAYVSTATPCTASNSISIPPGGAVNFPFTNITYCLSSAGSVVIELVENQ